MLNSIQQYCPTLYVSLQEAIAVPDAISLHQLWTQFDAAIVELDEEALLQVAGEMIVQMADIFVLKTDRVAQRVMSGSHRNEPIVPIDFFDRFVRTTMIVDLDQFIEPMGWFDLPPLDGLDPQWDVSSSCAKGIEDAEPKLESSIVNQVPIAVLLDWMDLLEESTADAINSESSDSESVGVMQAVSHEENIEAWSAQLSRRLASCPEERMSFSALVQELDLPPDAIWLALLLGDHPYELQRKHDDFYSESGIEIVRKDAKTQPGEHPVERR